MKTEQDLIYGNIVLAEYYYETKLKFKDRRIDYQDNKWIFLESENTSPYLVLYNKPCGFHSLWQVLQKIEKDTTLFDYCGSENESRIANLLEILDGLIEDKADPIDIFWAAVELITEYNKYLKK